jgi:CRISPR-associated protein Csm5
VSSVIRPLSITTLSPIHIGCDEVFDPSKFVIHDGLLHVLSPSDIMLALEEKERQQLLALTERADPIGPLQQFFKARRQRLAHLAVHVVDVAPAIATEYDTKSGQVQQRGEGGQPVYNLFPIARTAFSPLDDTPYLPGSSLKGSIRTAWLSRLNRGEAPKEEERKDASKLQQRLLGYRPGKFENDPFRLVRLADAHPDPDDIPPATRILYAVSKKKRPSERGSPEIKVFLESVREAQSGAFRGELRLGQGSIRWHELCDACNDFYWPKLAEELDHSQFGPLLAADWRALMSRLLGNEMDELRSARQGFLLRVGRHSGAESVTLEGVRSIKIIGKEEHGRKTFDFRSNTTEKRFASQTRAAVGELLPFGWIWIDGSDDAHQHLSIAVADQLRTFSGPMRDAHRARIEAAEQRCQAKNEAVAAQTRRIAEAAAAAQAEAEAQAAHAAALAAMTENMRRIEEFKSMCAKRADQLQGNRENANAAIHNAARVLAKNAIEGADWTADEKRTTAETIEEWLPKLVNIDIKDERKKLKLAALRA